MRKATHNGGCNKSSGSHKVFKDRAKNRVDDLQGMFTDLQSARKESRTVDVAMLEEQVHQMLREWKAELNQPSPASSLQQDGSLGSFSSEICRLLQLREEEDDATSALAALKPDPDGQRIGDSTVLNEAASATLVAAQDQGYPLVDDCEVSYLGVDNTALHNMGIMNHVDYHSFDLQEVEQRFFNGFDGIGLFVGEDAIPENSGFLPNISPPPYAFLGPKCALWDCPRPAQGWCSERPVQGWCLDYCSSLHATIAQNEGHSGMSPVVRPKGIELKDNLLFAALSAKSQGKDVGVPECEGAATSKSPWNAPELFDLKVFEGEAIREWLFFDKPRRAFESGNRKQRSLPDYIGRGWHESRKQVVNESGWLKRSYYMDPQPTKNLEWHLYEYEISKCDACALYRLELKLVDGKKSPKGKVAANYSSVTDLQKQMGRLTAEFPLENNRSVKGRGKPNLKGSGPPVNALSAANQTDDGFDYGANNYVVEDLSGYYEAWKLPE